MSSILKALKKIDETSRPPGDHHQWPHAGALKDTLTKNIKRRWFFRRALTGLLAAVFLISLAAVLFYLRSGDRPAPAGDPPRAETGGQEAAQVHRSKIAPSPPAGEEPVTAGGQENAGNARAALAGKQPSSGSGSIREKTVGRTGEDRRPPEARRPLPKVSKKAATKTAAPASGGGGGEAGAGKNTSGSSAKPPPPEETAQYSRLRKPDLVLQAIAWSPDPAKRIAVVNGSVVREGESVAGYVLMRIRQDDIVLNDGAKSWQLDFSLQQ